MKFKTKKNYLLILCLIGFILSCNNDISSEFKSNTNIESRAVSYNNAADLIFRYFYENDRYIREENINGKDITYVAMQAKGKKNPIPAHYTTSEATAYGMRLAIYGYKSTKGNSKGDYYRRGFYKKTFNSLWKTQSEFKSTEDSRLHSWIIPKSLNKRDSSACKTDSELDMAYALLQAHKLWGSNNEFDYKYEATRILDGIAQSLTNTVNINGREITYLKVGDWMGNNDTNALYSRPSDWMLHHFKTFILFLQSENKYGTNTYVTFNHLLYDAEYIFELNPFGSGFLPDFVHFNQTLSRIETVTPGSQFDIDMDEDVLIDKYSWNACRIPWRLAMDVVLNKEPFSAEASRNILKQIYKKVYLGNNSNSNAIGSGYNLSGNEIVPYYSVAFAAPVVSSIYYVKVNSFGASKYVHDIKNKELPILRSKYSGNQEWGYYGDSILCFTTVLLENDREVLAPPY